MRYWVIIFAVLCVSCFRNAGGSKEIEPELYEVTVTVRNESDHLTRILKYFRIHEANKIIVVSAEEGSTRASRVTARLKKLQPFTERELQLEIEEMDGVEKVVLERLDTVLTDN